MPPPKTEASAADKDLRLLHSKIPFVKSWRDEPWVPSAIPQFDYGAHEQRAFGRSDWDRPSPRPEGLLVGFFVPRLAVINYVALNPDRMSFKVSRGEIAELLQFGFRHTSPRLLTSRAARHCWTNQQWHPRRPLSNP